MYIYIYIRKNVCLKVYVFERKCIGRKCIRSKTYIRKNMYRKEYRVSHTSYVKYKERNIDIPLNTYVCL